MYVKAIWDHKWIAKYTCTYPAYKNSQSIRFKMSSVTKNVFPLCLVSLVDSCVGFFYLLLTWHSEERHFIAVEQRLKFSVS